MKFYFPNPKECRIAAIKPSNTSKYEIEILEAPPVIIDSGDLENLDVGSAPLRDARDAADDDA